MDTQGLLLLIMKLNSYNYGKNMTEQEVEQRAIEILGEEIVKLALEPLGI